MSEKEFERAQYNERVKQLKARVNELLGDVKDLEKENAKLWRIIKRLNLSKT